MCVLPQAEKPSTDPDVQMVNSYELALTTGKTFLSTFMKKWVIDWIEQNT